MSVDGEAVWNGSASARWPYLLAVLGVLIAVGLLVLGGAAWAWLPVFGALVAMPFSKIRVTVDPVALTVRFRGPGWLRVRIRIAQVEEVSSLDVNPLRWGGWGYRGSLRLFRRAAVVVRKGPGIRLNLTRRRVFVVTVDDAEQGAAAVQAMRDGRGSA